MANPNAQRDPFVQRVLDAAQAHGEQSGVDFEAGDLQGVVWRLWKLLSPIGRAAALNDPELLDLIEAWGGQ